MSSQASSSPTRRRLGPPASVLGGQGALADELGLVQVDQPAEPDLVRRIGLVGVHRVAGAGVVDLEQDQAGLQADDVEGDHPGRPDAVWLAGDGQRVPHVDGSLGGDPQLIAEVAGVAGPADVDGRARDGRRAAPEVAQVGEGLARRRLEDGPAARPLERDGGEALADVLDLDVEPARVHRQPAVLGIRRGPAEAILGQAMDGAVVDDLAVLVAPRRVVDGAVPELGRVAGDDPVDELQGVAAADLVLVERADVDQGGLLADRVVLDVVEVGVDAGREIARPLAPLHLPVVRLGPGVERGPDAQGASSAATDRVCRKPMQAGWVREGAARAPRPDRRDRRYARRRAPGRRCVHGARQRVNDGAVGPVTRRNSSRRERGPG